MTDEQREKARKAYELSLRLAKDAMYAGVYGNPFPEEILNLRGGHNGAIDFFRQYYDAGAAIGRRDQSPIRQARFLCNEYGVATDIPNPDYVAVRIK